MLSVLLPQATFSSTELYLTLYSDGPEICSLCRHAEEKLESRVIPWHDHRYILRMT